MDILFSGKFLFENEKLYVPRDDGRSYNCQDILNILQHIKNLNMGKHMFKDKYSCVNQKDITMAFLLHKVEMLEKQNKDLQEMIGAAPKTSIKEDLDQTTEKKSEPNDENMEHYKKICGKISCDNQFYDINMYGKNNHYQASFMNAEMVIDDYCCPKVLDFSEDQRYHNMFVLFENEHVIIFIRGIAEHNVYAVIVKLRKEYGLV